MIHNAARHMRKDEEPKSQFLSAIKVGQDQVASGQHRELTSDVLNELRLSVTRKIQERHKPKFGVLPE